MSRNRGLRAAVSDHYFARDPASPRRPIELRAQIRGRFFRFRSDAGVFSAARVDPGTRLLAQVMEVGAEHRVLDLGCGYGVLGIVAATLAPRGFAVLLDRNIRAVELAQLNLRLNHIANAHVVLGDGPQALADDACDVVVTNPPVHAGNRAVFAFIEGAHPKLRTGGSFYLVGRTRRGVATFAGHMEKTFGNLVEVEKQSGYRVYRSRREERQDWS
jgi:16S rRNA (guanine1207-N2)-methyltransferase